MNQWQMALAVGLLGGILVVLVRGLDKLDRIIRLLEIANERSGRSPY